MKPNMAAIEEYRKKVLVQCSAANLFARVIFRSVYGGNKIDLMNHRQPNGQARLVKYLDYFGHLIRLKMQEYAFWQVTYLSIYFTMASPYYIYMNLRLELYNWSL